MSVARLLIGDCRQLISQLPDGSVDCLITSPPYPWQRSYLPDDHPEKAAEMGTEADPAEALGALLDVMDAAWPKLADHATFWVNLGDPHAGSPRLAMPHLRPAVHRPHTRATPLRHRKTLPARLDSKKER